MITVCSRIRDPKTEMVQKYSNEPFIKMPVRKLSPKKTGFALADAIITASNGKYIGGFYNPFTCTVEGPVGSQMKIDVATLGEQHYQNIKKCYGSDDSARARCNWLFSVIEPELSDEDYFVVESLRMEKLAGPGGRVIIGNTVHEVSSEDIKSYNETDFWRAMVKRHNWWRGVFATMWKRHEMTGKPKMYAATFPVSEKIRNAAAVCGKYEKMLGITH